jgi:hypothetical protein
MLKYNAINITHYDVQLKADIAYLELGGIQCAGRSRVSR